jgi:hypothetical protein
VNDPGASTIEGAIEDGRPAPDFTLASDSGESVTLSSFGGARVVLYFYPKDDTLPRSPSNRGSRPAVSAAP